MIKQIAIFNFLPADIIKSNWSHSTESVNLILTNVLVICDNIHVFIFLIKIYLLNVYSVEDVFLCEIKHKNIHELLHQKPIITL